MSAPINVEIILMRWLQANRFEGLSNADEGCACETSDLAPCDGIQLACRPGHKAPCDCGDHDWHIEER